MYRAFFKRLFDVTFAVVSLVILAPVMLVVAICIKAEDHGQVLFRQRRVGLNDEHFDFLKFRSMPEETSDAAKADAVALPVTKIGRLIRRTNLDELPQLFNILRGEMSVVGPRPPIPSQTHLCLLRDANGASACLPGLTGLAQVKGYDGMPETEKAQWDGNYAANVSFLNDIKIIAQTFKYIMKRPPVY